MGTLGDDYCFFASDLNPKNIQLIALPEKVHVVADIQFAVVSESSTKVRLRCLHCNAAIGSEIPHGPNKSTYLAFKHDMVYIGLTRPLKKMKWHEWKQKYPTIATRTMDTFFGVISQKVQQSQSIAHTPYELVMPRISVSGLQVFNCENFLSANSNKNVRSYQKQAYVECLLQNTVLVMPTGTGKTLVAALVMHCFCQLNPNRTAVMVVDRVPLVFQQKEALTRDTGMRVLGLCGENKTEARVSRWLDGFYDAVVITAGCFVSLLECNTVIIDMFSVIVFDECHHASGNHHYTTILQRINSYAGSNQPRVIGLSASPFDCKSFDIAQKSMKILREQFIDARYCCPDTGALPNITHWEIVRPVDAEERFIQTVRQYLIRLAERINCVASMKLIDIKQLLDMRWGLVRGQLRFAKFEFTTNKDICDLIQEMHVLLTSLEVCALLGTCDAVKHVERYCDSDLLSILPAIRSMNSRSARFNKLVEILRRQSSEAKVLIFVDTRSAARLVSKTLEEVFPKMAPMYVVGHGSGDGMQWEGEGQQKETIDSLRRGESRILVCTSVLEEGLDVPVCDLVVGFMTDSSLIKFIQRRGRARKIGSTMSVVLTHEELEVVERVQNQERIMHSVLLSSSAPSTKARHIIDDLISSGTDVHFMDKSLDISSISSKSGLTRLSDALCFCVFGDLCSKEDETVSYIEESLLDIASVVVEKAQVYPSSAKTLIDCEEVFDVCDSFILIGIQNTYPDAIFDICRSWNFQCSISRNEVMPLWLQIKKNNTTENPLCSAPSISVMSVSVGELCGRQIFCKHRELYHHWDSVAISSECSICFYWQNCDVDMKMEFSKSSLHGCCLLSADRVSNTVQLLFSIVTPPVITIGDSRIVSSSTSNLKDDIYEAYTDIDALSDSSVVSLMFDVCHWEKVCHLALNLCVPAFHTRITTIYAPQHLSFDLNASMILSEAQRACIWNMSVLIANNRLPLMGNWRFTVLSRVHNAIANNNDIHTLVLVLEHLPQYLDANDCSLWTDADTVLNKLQQEHCGICVSAKKVKQNFVRLKRILVTPSRIIPEAAIDIPSSRFLRTFAGAFDFAIVRFQDEEQRFLSDESCYNRIRNICSRGLRVSGTTYRFLFCSSAQSRNQSAFFVAGSVVDVEKIRAECCGLNKPTSIPKYASVLALFATADTPTIEIPSRMIKVIDDSSSPCLSDGAGRISASLANKVLSVYNCTSSGEFGTHDELVSAIQIRLGGLKGVLQVDYSSTNDDFICIRPSMVKWKDTTHHTLCVVKTSRYLPLYMNREIITLLLSLRSESYDPLLAISTLHENQLSDALLSFVNTEQAISALSVSMDSREISQVVAANFNILVEPMWNSLLRLSYENKIRALRNKTRLRVHEGALLMGVVDEYDCLGADEIFIQISIPETGIRNVIAGNVIIFRNPCLHPGLSS